MVAGVVFLTVSTRFPEISFVGHNEEELAEGKVPYEIGKAQYREIARGNIIGDSIGMLKLLFDRATRELLGVHIVGGTRGGTRPYRTGRARLSGQGGLLHRKPFSTIRRSPSATTMPLSTA